MTAPSFLGRPLSHAVRAAEYHQNLNNTDVNPNQTFGACWGWSVRDAQSGPGAQSDSDFTQNRFHLLWQPPARRVYKVFHATDTVQVQSESQV